WPRHQGPRLEDGTRGCRTSPSSARSRAASWGGSTASIERTRRRPCGLLAAGLATMPLHSSRAPSRPSEKAQGKLWMDAEDDVVGSGGVLRHWHLCPHRSRDRGSWAARDGVPGASVRGSQQSRG
ncbi:unnamed protein product, partial [Ectocarpus sp. 6 AP-2014]